jgi:hypothetical protein
MKQTFRPFDKSKFDERTAQGLCVVCCDPITKDDAVVSEPYGDKHYPIHASHINYKRK